MAQPTPDLIAALRQTAIRLAGGAPYQWTHMGACNCGHLAQSLTSLSKEEIHRQALEKYGDWSDKAEDYCPTSGFPIDHIITLMVSVGLSTSDIAALERLGDRHVLRALPAGQPPLNYKRREDVVVYLNTWASLLESQWLAQTSAISLPLPEALSAPALAE